jgi:hypothetical protein
MWDQMSKTNFDYYQNNDVDLVFVDENGKLIVPGSADTTDSSYGRQFASKQHTISGMLILSGNHTITLHLVPTTTFYSICSLEQTPSPSIQVNSASTSDPSNPNPPASTLTEGSDCSGDLISSDPQLKSFQCPADSPCQPVGGSSLGDWKCQPKPSVGGFFNNILNVRTLPPCAQWVNSNGNNITEAQAAALMSEGAIEKIWNAITMHSTGTEATGNEDSSVAIINCKTFMTGLGQPIDTDAAGFVKGVFSIVLGLSGGIALILIIISGYKYMASQGNPEAVKSATEQLTSAIVGLLFIIFSFVILQIIGVDILRIPGFQ